MRQTPPSARQANSGARTLFVIAATVLLLSLVFHVYCQFAWIYQSMIPILGDVRP